MFLKMNFDISFKISELYNNTITNEACFTLADENIKAGGASWNLECTAEESRNGVHRLFIELTAGNDCVCPCAAEVVFTAHEWSLEHYLMLPAAVYDGNRFRCFPQPYPPLIVNPDEFGKDFPITVTDVPRLEPDGKSLIELTSGDLAAPIAGFFNPKSQEGVFIMFTQGNEHGNYGIKIREDTTENRLELSLGSPCARQNMYHMCNKSIPSDDKQRIFKQGEKIRFSFELHSFKCDGITEFYDCYFNIRKNMSHSEQVNTVPFSHAWNIMEQSHNANRWNEKGKYYSCFEDNFYDYQIGWVGGMQASHAMLLNGNTLSRTRALESLETTLTKTQTDAGFLLGCGKDDHFYCDGIWDVWPHNMHAVRKSGDGLYFIIKQLICLKKQENLIPAVWESAVKRLAEAFDGLWRANGQIGQIVDIETGDILIGGSAAGAIVPAGLALAAEYFSNESWIASAKQIADYFYKTCTQKGVTTGGPTEILQCPDSESSFVLLESFVILYEVTGEDTWLKKACDAAHQFSSWCVTYDYEWPENSEFSRLGIKTTGSVFANVQNKHSAPGICTGSGDVLLKLYRYTKNTAYLELLRDIAHNITQYVSREDRPVRSYDGLVFPVGMVNERVNMSDWEGKDRIGEVFYGQTWAEAASMLTYAELPGIYCQPDTGFICVFDHVTAELINKDGTQCLRIHNPTAYDAEVKLFIENSFEMNCVLGSNFICGCDMVTLTSNETKEIHPKLSKGVQTWGVKTER